MIELETKPLEKRLRRFERFAWVALLSTLGVILWGAYVRATGSGAGCGDHWPLCNGQVLPRAPELNTLIELIHRITSGVSLIFAGVLWGWARSFGTSAVRRFAGWSLVFMLLEAAVGAGLVLLKLVADDSSALRAVALGVHLTNTLILVAVMTGTVLAARQSVRAGRILAWTEFWLWPRDERRVMLGLLGFLMAVGIAGAITALGDTLFPAGTLAEGLRADLDPLSHFLVRLRVFHPLLGVLCLAYAFYAWQALPAIEPQAARLGQLLLGLFLAQVGLGFLNIVLLAPVWMQLVHLLVADLLWVTAVSWRSRVVVACEVGRF